MMRAESGDGFERSAWRIGRTNAAVFPLPVWARPMMSRPLSEYGSDCAWMEVGWFHPNLLMESQRRGSMPSEGKVWEVSKVLTLSDDMEEGFENWK